MKTKIISMLTAILTAGFVSVSFAGLDQSKYYYDYESDKHEVYEPNPVRMNGFPLRQEHHLYMKELTPVTNPPTMRLRTMVPGSIWVPFVKD